MLTLDKAISVLDEARHAPFTPKTGPTGGCGRAYVCLTTSDKAVTRIVANACKVLGLHFEPKGHYGTGRNSIYIGYDNADGRALARSEAFSQSLNASGLECFKSYTDAVSD